jgi:gamma-glutamyltranspeptidase/glutathione hydrolase
MARPRLAIASGNKPGADAAEAVARAGGNAVDACLASAVTGWVAAPFFASIGGSGFATVRPPDGAVEVIDGNNSMPAGTPAHLGQGLRRVYLDYSNGMYTGIGGGSVATPGILAAVHRTWERHGSIEWAALFDAAIAAARDGIDVPRTSAYYLTETWPAIWSQYRAARALFGTDAPIPEGHRLVQAELADVLEAVARDGPGALYGGAVGAEVADAVGADDGFLSLDDLSAYDAMVRAPVTTEAFGWRVESNPPPAVGGALLTHLLELLRARPADDPVKRLVSFIDAEQVVVGYRKDRYEDPDDVAIAYHEAISALRGTGAASPSTTHASAADSDGLVCALTESCGYGAGLVVNGIVLNNTLGEEELNPMGAHRLTPGSRCHSNMTPTVASGPDRVVGLGSPGADRIVGAVAQTFLRLAIDGLGLADAVAAPRAHLAMKPSGPLLCYERGLPGEDLPYALRPYAEPHMYFGAVQAASVADDGTVDAAHDPRRSGASTLI